MGLLADRLPKKHLADDLCEIKPMELCDSVVRLTTHQTRIDFRNNERQQVQECLAFVGLVLCFVFVTCAKSYPLRAICAYFWPLFVVTKTKNLRPWDHKPFLVIRSGTFAQSRA